VFFFHSVPNSTLTSIDVLPEERIEMRESAMSTPDTMIETHCRRCGSHLGHIVLVEGDVLHCINGTSLVFNEAT
jgi:peptide-methionine (R)-S-oxide reductase